MALLDFGRRGTQRCSCPPPCGLLLYLTALSATPSFVGQHDLRSWVFESLRNGVKGGKWFSLIDKVYRPSTLQAAWAQVRANKGAAGIDRQSVERFAANEPVYLNELAKDLEQGKYQAQAV